MKRIVVWILALGMLLSLGAAGAESALPEIPDFQGALNVRPIVTEEEAIAYAKEIWALDYLGFDFPVEYYEADRFEQDCWAVYAKDGPDEGDYCFGDVMFDIDGNVVLIENASSGVFEVINEAESTEETALPEEERTPEEEDALAEWRSMLDRKIEYPFLEKTCPRVYEEYTALYPVREGTNTEFLTHYYGTYTDSYDNANVFILNYSESFQDGTWRVAYAIQVSPVIRIVYFDVYTDAEIGGNG